MSAIPDEYRRRGLAAIGHVRAALHVHCDACGPVTDADRARDALARTVERTQR